MYTCLDLTTREIQAHPDYKHLSGRSKAKTKKELCELWFRTFGTYKLNLGARGIIDDIVTKYGNVGLHMIPNEFEPQKILGEGDSGTAYLFKNGPSKRVVKFIKNETTVNVLYEIYMQSRFFKHGLAPKVISYDMWKENNRAVAGIVMEKAEFMANDYFNIREYSSHKINFFVNEIGKLLKRMCAAGLRHNDLHFGNIAIVEYLVEREEGLVDPANPNIDDMEHMPFPLLIDFGYASEESPKRCDFRFEFTQMFRTIGAHAYSGKYMLPQNRVKLSDALYRLYRKIVRTQLPSRDMTDYAMKRFDHTKVEFRPTYEHKSSVVKKNQTWLSTMRLYKEKMTTTPTDLGRITYESWYKRRQEAAASPLYSREQTNLQRRAKSRPNVLIDTTNADQRRSAKPAGSRAPSPTKRIRMSRKPKQSRGPSADRTRKPVRGPSTESSSDEGSIVSYSRDPSADRTRKPTLADLESDSSESSFDDIPTPPPPRSPSQSQRSPSPSQGSLTPRTPRSPSQSQRTPSSPHY